MIWAKLFFLGIVTLVSVQELHAEVCPKDGLYLQVLGSGGPEIGSKRASSSFLIWNNGKAQFLIDAGGGSALRFGESTAKVSDLKAILFTHLHIDHSADLAVLIKSSYFEARRLDLPIYGPTGNKMLPSMAAFIEHLFSKKAGVWPYMSDYLVPKEHEYQIIAHNISKTLKIKRIRLNKDICLETVSTHHGSLPAIAWKVEVDGVKIAFSGDMNGDYKTLEKLARDADLLVANHAIPEAQKGAGRALHMPPSLIGQIAETASVKKLVLAHRMNRTLGKEQQSRKMIAEKYKGEIIFAEDLQCFQLTP